MKDTRYFTWYHPARLVFSNRDVFAYYTNTFLYYVRNTRMPPQVPALRGQQHAKIFVFRLHLDLRDWKSFRQNIFGNFWTSSGNLQKWLLHFRKSRSWRDENLMHLTWKKLAGIYHVVDVLLPHAPLLISLHLWGVGNAIHYFRFSVSNGLFRGGGGGMII